MNIYFESPQRLKIELSGTDLKELGITYHELDYASPKTRQILSDLLYRIGANEDFDLQSRRLVIEILPLKDDGCAIYFTVVQPSAAHRMKIKSDAPVWEFGSADDLIDAASALKNAGCELKISLYLLDNRYRLIPAERADGICTLILNEYGRRVGSRSAALHTCEHARLLCGDLIAALPDHKTEHAASLS